MIEGIPVVLQCDFLQRRDEIKARKLLVFTGPIDEFFGYDLGKLAYRGQQREHVYIPGVKFAQSSGQVNNPNPANGPHIRTLEWKHMMQPEYARRIDGTVLTKEITISPADPDRYEYPFPDKGNGDLYDKYRERASRIPNLLICGRLGEYRYYDMDQAIARAMTLANNIFTQD